MKYRLILAFSVFFIFIDCNKNESLIIRDEDNLKNFGDYFDFFWIKMNQNYSYWDIDKSNWDSLYKVFKPRFSKLNINSDEDKKKSISFFKQLTSSFVDSHFLITFQDKAVLDSSIYPSYIKKNNIPRKYDFTFLDLNYFDAGFVTGNYYYKENNVDKVLFTQFAKIKEKILFFSINSFALTRALNNNDKQTKNVIDSLNSYLSDDRDAFKGIIFDLRGNQGGDIADLNFLFGKLINTPVNIGYFKYKNGDGRLDYTPWIKATLNPANRNQHFSKPIVVLIDRYTASLAELFAMSLGCLPNTVLIGERTWGATSFIVNGATYGYGSFEIKNFLKAEMASGQFKYVDDVCYEGIGYPPDIEVKFNLSDYQSGIDTQLDSAIKFIFK